MKKILLSLIVTISVISCKEKTEIKNETSTEMSEVKTEVKDSLTEKKTEILFADYKTEYKETTEKAKIDFNSNPTVKGFKTVISETYKNGVVNFAGYYIIATWGCGTSCISGAMIDVRDGKVYDLPSGEMDGIGNSYSSDKSSSLLITGLYWQETIEDYWNWNESKKEFEHIKTVESKETKN